MSADRPRYRPPRPDEEEPESTPIGEHTHKQPRSVLFLTATVIALLLANLGTLVYAYNVEGRLSNLESFVADAKVKRDRQNVDVNERITKVVCDILNGLPAGALLDPIRTEYDCGPGVPVDQLSPEVLGNLQQFGTVIPEPAQPLPRLKPEPGRASQPAVPSQEPSAQPAPAAPTPAPSAAPTPGLPVVPDPVPAAPTTPPLVDVSGLTDLVCAATGVCA